MSRHRPMPRPGSARSGFTLIELMIAIALSSVILMTAFSALRVVSQSVTLTNRLSLENGLMRAGFMAASNELDFWTAYDDPLDPTQQPLRSVGKPFAPLTYDPAKPISDPKHWWRGFGCNVSGVVSSTAWGDYSLMSQDGMADPVRSWLPGQTRNLLQTLGNYGAIGYLPGDAIFAYYDSNKKLTAVPKDVWAYTENTAYTVDPAKAYNQGAVDDLMPSRPTSWPGLTIETRRYVIWSHSLDSCLVKVTSPVTGETIRYAFWGVGTTLRGARQQRGLDTVAIR